MHALLFSTVAFLLAEAPTKDSILGILAVFGVAVVVVVGVTQAGESRIGRIVDNRLRDPGSDFASHKHDEKAHEAMRNKLSENFEESLSALRNDVNSFTRSVIEPLVATNAKLMENQGRTLDLLGRAMERQARRRIDDLDDEK